MSLSTSPGPLNVFFSYAREDERLLNKLEQHLSLLWRQKLINNWRESRPLPGELVQREDTMRLQSAHIILLLISKNFMASDQCYHEMQLALERREDGKTHVIPVLLQPLSGWRDAPFGKLAILPDNKKPVTSWKNRDLAFANIADGIRQVIDTIRQKSRSAYRRPHHTIIEHPPLFPPRVIQPREHTVKKLYEQVIAPATTAVVLSGIAGAGKTTLANLLYHYAEQQRGVGNGPFTTETLKLRIDATTTQYELIEAVFEALGEPLPDTTIYSSQDLVTLLFRILKDATNPRLIIFDQFENLLNQEIDAPDSPIRQWLHLLNTQQSSCHLVLVSRIRLTSIYDSPELYMHNYYTTGLEIDEGVRLLRSWDIKAAPTELQEIVKRFGGHAMALCLFASLLHNQDWPLADVLNERALQTPVEDITRFIEQVYDHQLDDVQRSLLFAFAIYREPVPPDAAYVLLDTHTALSGSNLRAALSHVSTLYLLQEVNGFYQLHTLVAHYIYNRYSSMHEEQNTALYTAHEKAAAYYRQHAMGNEHPRPIPERANHDTIEAIWHLCQAQQWQRAYTLMVKENIFPYLLHRGRNSVLLELYQQFLPLDKWNAEPQQRGCILKDLGVIYNRLSSRKDAHQHLEQALNLFRTIGERSYEAETLTHLGEVYNALEQKKQALMCYEQALSIYEEEGPTSEPMKAIVLNNLGKIAFEQGQKEQALAYYKQSLLLHSDVSEEATTLNNLGALYEDLKQMPEAYRYYKKSLRFFQESGDLRGEGSVLHNLGRYWRKQGKIEEAQECYERAWRIFREIGDRWSESTTLRNLAQLYLVQERYRLALVCIFLTKKIFEEMQSPHLNDLQGTIVLLSHQIGKEQFESIWTSLDKGGLKMTNTILHSFDDIDV